MELFENILTGERTSYYKTNYFHMVVDGDILYPNMHDMSDKDFGTFIHEYIHYIQHITTLFGVRMCDMFNKLAILYRDIIAQNDVIQLPLEISDTNVQNFLEYHKIVRGDNGCNHNVDAVDVLMCDIEAARINVTAVNIGCYDFENDKIYEKGFLFGYTCVIESMAHAVQKLFCDELNHPAVPYSTAELILKELYPKWNVDQRLIASICYCALQWNNPGVGFFDVARIAMAHPELNGCGLYRFIMKYEVSHKGQLMPMDKLLMGFMKEFRLNLNQLIGTPLIYYSTVIDSCINEVQDSNSVLLDVLYNVPATDKAELFNLLTKHYGYPYIEANNSVVLPCKNGDVIQQRLYIETAVLLGWEVLVARFHESGGNLACIRLPFCQKWMYVEEASHPVTEDCVQSPWKKKETCLFTQCMKYYGFENKTFVERPK